MGRSVTDLKLLFVTPRVILNVYKAKSRKYQGDTKIHTCMRNPKSTHVKAKKKISVFTVRRPTLIFGPDLKLFYGTCSRKLFKYPIIAYECSFWCLSDNYFDKNELNITLQL